jgi:hypothetical protein
MGTGELGFHSERIQRSGEGIDASAQQMKARLQTFMSELNGHGQPWGNDDLGSLIGMCYQAICEVAMESYDDNVTDLQGHGKGVTVMGANYASGEEKNEIEVNRVRDLLA